MSRLAGADNRTFGAGESTGNQPFPPK